MRTYEKTHPWISFQIDLSRAPTRLWVLLGEAQSKCEHIAGVPLRPSTASELHQLYLAKGALATTAIEGNTLSEQEVLKHLEGHLKLPPSREYLAQEIDNIVAACNDIAAMTLQDQAPSLAAEWIKELNQRVLANLPLEKGVIPGQVRLYEVFVARYKGAPAEDCDYLLTELSKWLSGDAFVAKENMSMLYAIIKAIVAHLYIAWIHPFGDGNGRTARLMEFQILISAGIPAPAAHLLSNHYNQTRTEYYRQLDYASESRGDVLPFILYAVQGFVDGLRAQLIYIRDQQWDIVWRNYVHELFKDRNTPSDVRRRRLVLDLSLHEEIVPVSKVTEVSTRIAKEYAMVGSKTLSRDLKFLTDLKLIVVEGGNVSANKGAILAFLPVRAKTTP